jgi:hypothetical protein
MTNVTTLPNIAALRAFTGTQPVIWVEGYTSTADGGEGMFANNGTSGTDNGGTIIKTTAGQVYVREYNNSPLNVCWFGAPVNSSTDSSPALTNALAALPAAGGTIYFPAGVFNFNASFTYTIPGTSAVFPVTFLGSGQDATILNWPKNSGGTAGILINASSGGHTVHFRDMAITTGYSCGVNGITVSQTAMGQNTFQSDFTRLTFGGYPFNYVDDSFAPSTYWGFGINIKGLSNIVFDTLLFWVGYQSGNAISLAGENVSGQYGVIYNLSKVTVWFGNTGLIMGPRIQGVTVDQSNFTFCETGIAVPSGQNGDAQLAVTSCQFNCTVNAISIESDLNVPAIIGNLFDFSPISSVVAGINATAAMTDATISGNAFVGGSSPGPSPVTGIITGPSFENAGGVISGNVFDNLNVGVNLTGSTGWNVQANNYTNTFGGSPGTPVVGGAGNSVGIATK